MSDSDRPLTFGDHLSELRSRLFACFLVFILGSLLGYHVHEYILEFLIKPLDQPIFYSSPGGGLSFVLQISFMFGFALSIPTFIYHTIKFIEPTLPSKSPKRLLLILIASCVLLNGGILFAYYVSLPAALYFLNTFASDNIQALISTTDYFDFVARYLIGFGFVFQLPLFMLVVNSVRRIQTATLFKYQPWIIVGSFILAAILTPTPDLFNQLIMALPIIVLYQIAILLVWLVNLKRPTRVRD